MQKSAWFYFITVSSIYIKPKIIRCCLILFILVRGLIFEDEPFMDLENTIIRGSFPFQSVPDSL